uniref:D-alanyl-D-alanine carboxypeptidase n=1 Tax=Acidobacterium capsulatum TaxID=33075 RepID=A0A7V4XUZ7_9BACT
MELNVASVRAYLKAGYSAKKSLRAGGCLLIALTALAMARPAQAVVHASLLMDARSGKVLYAYHANERTHPASLTKLMTLYLTFQRLQAGRMRLDERLHISPHAAGQQPSKMWLRAGGTVSVRSCILGIISHSANDAAVTLAEGMAGTEWRFTRLMNEQARRLGMTHTIFFNASGLPDGRQWTTAYDMAKLARALIYTFPQYYHFFDVHAFRYQGRTLYSYDRLPLEYTGVDGMKTGYINSSGFNIVTSAVRNHRRLIGVVLGGATAHSRDLQMIALLNRGFRSPLLTAHVTSHPRLVHHRPARKVLASLPENPNQTGDNTWVIQVGGGFRSAYQVRRVLHSARLSAPSLMHHGHAIVVLLRGRQYRARFAHLSRISAFEACSALRSRRFTCRILSHAPERPQYMASTAEGAPAKAH